MSFNNQIDYVVSDAMNHIEEELRKRTPHVITLAEVWDEDESFTDEIYEAPFYNIVLKHGESVSTRVFEIYINEKDDVVAKIIDLETDDIEQGVRVSEMGVETICEIADRL